MARSGQRSPSPFPLPPFRAGPGGSYSRIKEGETNSRTYHSRVRTSTGLGMDCSPFHFNLEGPSLGTIQNRSGMSVCSGRGHSSVLFLE